MTDLKGIEFVIFDVETTGLSPYSGDRIVEIAAVKLKDSKIVGRFETMLDPQREISYEAFSVNGITPEMLSGAPRAEEVLPDIFHFIKNAYLVGHNIKFDLNFLNNEFVLAGWPPLEDLLTIDTVKMARGLLPQLGRYSLGAVAYSLGMSYPQKHRAMSDVEMTLGVFQKLLELAEDKKISDLNLLTSLFGYHPSWQKIQEGKVDMITEAIFAEHRLNLLYFGTNSGLTSRIVKPQQLIGDGRETVLVGFCHLRNEERHFRLDRIVQLEKFKG